MIITEYLLSYSVVYMQFAVDLIRDQETKVSCGCGYIVFECPEDCEDAVCSMNGQVLVVIC